MKRMFILVKNNELMYEDRLFKCAVGMNGLIKNKFEGDGCTPVGIFNFTKIFYRADRLGKLNFKIKSSIIREDDGWCDDTKSKFYNQHIKFPFIESAENLFRSDDLYDLVCVLSYNSDPIIPGRGSAIFLHIAKKDFDGTKGCIAIEKSNIIELAKRITVDSKIKIAF